MKTAQDCVAIALALCVAAAIYLSFRDVALPEASGVDAVIRESEPLQGPSAQRPFAVTIDSYRYALAPKATYDIPGLVVSQHRGDSMWNLYHKVDPGNIKDVCVVWGEDVTNGSSRKVRFSSEEFPCNYSWSGAISPPFN